MNSSAETQTRLTRLGTHRLALRRRESSLAFPLSQRCYSRNQLPLVSCSQHCLASHFPFLIATESCRVRRNPREQRRRWWQRQRLGGTPGLWTINEHLGFVA